VSVVLTVAAIGIYLGRSWQVGLALLVASVVVIGLVRFVGSFSLLHQRTRLRARLRSRETELLRRALPEVPAAFGAAQSEQELFAALDALAERGTLVSVEIRYRGRNGSPPAHRWTDGRNGRRIIASMTYPLGHDALARAEVQFCCVNELEDVEMSPQTDVLLQVVTDVLAANLTRLGSELAPRTSADRDAAADPAAAAPTSARKAGGEPDPSSAAPKSGARVSRPAEAGNNDPMLLKADPVA
jgi:hypothetical protein